MRKNRRLCELQIDLNGCAFNISRPSSVRTSAECNSAIQQVTNLRYKRIRKVSAGNNRSRFPLTMPDVAFSKAKPPSGCNFLLSKKLNSFFALHVKVSEK